MQTIRRFYGHILGSEGEGYLQTGDLRSSLGRILEKEGFELKSFYTSEGFRTSDITPITLSDGINVSRQIEKLTTDRAVSNVYGLTLNRDVEFEKFTSLVIQGEISEDLLKNLHNIGLRDDQEVQRNKRNLSQYIRKGLFIDRVIWGKHSDFPTFIPPLREPR